MNMKFRNKKKSLAFQIILDLNISPKFQILRRGCFFLLMLVIYYLAFTSAQYQIQTTFSDKVNHAFAFFVLAFVQHIAYPQSSLAKSFTFLLLYGISIEIVQSFLPYRDGSVLDLITDTVSIAIYLWLCRPYISRILSLNSKQC